MAEAHATNLVSMVTKSLNINKETTLGIADVGKSMNPNKVETTREVRCSPKLKDL